MNYFKHPKTGEIYGYESQEDRDKYGASELVKLTDKELESHLGADKQSDQKRINSEALRYLASTDWYVIRHQESGTPIPDDVMQKRAAARESVIHE